MSEGQPALTPEVAARWASEARMATGQNDHLWANRMSTALAELAREREATEAAQNDAASARSTLHKALRNSEALEGRVRELREALEEILENYDADGFVRERAREALVGLPERPADGIGG